jgi:Phage tail baseplate hub (GPD)
MSSLLPAVAGNTFSIVVNGQSAADLAGGMAELDVEENVDMPSAFSLTLPVNVTASGDYDTVNDARLAPLSNVCITATASDGQTQCLIDGYVLAQTAHLDTGAAGSTLKVWGQDATWLLNTTERAKEWADVTDGAVANTIFGNYGVTPDDANLTDDSPAHTSDGYTLMQRGTDAQFLRMLARRNGKLFRIYCTDTPGQRTGSFAKPSLDGDPVTVLTLNDATAATVDALDISWDVMRPSAVTAMQALFTSSDPDGAGGTVTDSGLDPLEAQTLANFAGTTVTSVLTATVDDGQELTERAESVLIEAGWFVRCEGTADVNRLGAILRAGTVVQLNAAGSLHSGKYFVWSVRHKITGEQHTMDFVLLRNAVGATPGAGLLPGGLGI